MSVYRVFADNIDYAVRMQQDGDLRGYVLS